MPKEDLPKHLRKRPHEDWVWPFSLIPRGWNAFGWRHSGWRRVPVFLFGYNTTRWMQTGDKDIVGIDNDGWSCYFTSIVSYFHGEEYGPSPLQKFSKWGFSVVWPLHFEFHYVFKNGKPLFFRIGARWDSYDEYYNIGVYLGLAWN